MDRWIIFLICAINAQELFILTIASSVIIEGDAWSRRKSFKNKANETSEFFQRPNGMGTVGVGGRYPSPGLLEDRKHPKNGRMLSAYDCFTDEEDEVQVD